MLTQRHPFYGGEYAPQCFKTESVLETINHLVDTGQDSVMNPYTGLPLPGPKRHFIDDSEETQLLTQCTLPILQSIGLTAIKPTFTVVVYPPRGILAPHIDSNHRQDGSKSALLTVAGNGSYDTFEPTLEIIDEIDRGNYPANTKHSQTVHSGDVILSHGEVIHGFRNGTDTRIVLGVLGVYVES